jgi:hypothetical protein
MTKAIRAACVFIAAGVGALMVMHSEVMPLFALPIAVLATIASAYGEP